MSICERCKQPATAAHYDVLDCLKSVIKRVERLEEMTHICIMCGSKTLMEFDQASNRFEAICTNKSCWRAH